MGSPHTCLPEAAVGAGHLRERGRVGSSSMNIDSQSFHTFGGLPIGHFNDLRISMIPKGGILDIVGSPILPLDPSGRQIGHFRDLKLAVILKASFQNWLVSRILVVGSMCQIIPVRLVRLLYFQVFISEGVINIGLFQN